MTIKPATALPWSSFNADLANSKMHQRFGPFVIKNLVAEKDIEYAVLCANRTPDLEAENKRLREDIRAALDVVTLELNPSNYDHDDACELNSQMIEATQILLAALSPQEGEDG